MTSTSRVLLLLRGLLLILCLSDCGGGGGGAEVNIGGPDPTRTAQDGSGSPTPIRTSPATPTAIATNTPSRSPTPTETLVPRPVANAGMDMAVTVGSGVVLDGSVSSDPLELPLTYAWSVVTHPVAGAGSFVSPTSVFTTFTPDATGTYVVGLTVNNGIMDSLLDTVRIESKVGVGNGQGLYSINFEDDTNEMAPSNGVWEVGRPVNGPGRAFQDSRVAGTVLNGDYPNWIRSGLVSPEISLPVAGEDEEIRLTFWHWFRFDASFDFEIGSRDAGQVRVSTEDDWNTWVTLEEFDFASPNWTRAIVDLTAFEGKRIRFAFVLCNGSNQFSEVAEGWYIDEVLVDVFS